MFEFLKSKAPAPADPRIRRLGAPRADVTYHAQEEPGHSATENQNQAEQEALSMDVDAAEGELVSVDALPSWRSIVPKVVRDSDERTCVVLDLEMREVLIVATPDYFASGWHNTLLSTLNKKRFKKAKELVATVEVIAEIRALADRKRPLDASATAQDEANLQLYHDIIKGAYEIGSSDLHIDLKPIDSKQQSIVRVRLDGKMREWKRFDTNLLRDAIAAGYMSASKKGTNSAPTWTTDRAINTITETAIGRTMIHGRLSTFPVLSGTGVVIRTVEADPDRIKVRSFEQLGFLPGQIEGDLMPTLSLPSGLFLIGGTTGSGKSTTIQTALCVVPNKEELAIWGVEDPAEVPIPGVMQISVQRNVDDTAEEVRLKFQAALRQILRLDPDMVFIGEIRDEETGSLASEAVMTGHGVVSTIHGSGAVDQLKRLCEGRIRLPRDILAAEDFLAASMWQALLRKLCEHCKVPAASRIPSIVATLQKRFGVNPSSVFCANEDGCEHCGVGTIKGDGRKGRTVATEIISKPHPEFLSLIEEGKWREAKHYWRNTRVSGFTDPDMTGKTAFEMAVYLASQSVVDPLDILRVFRTTFEDYEILPLKGVRHVSVA